MGNTVIGLRSIFLLPTVRK